MSNAIEQIYFQNLEKEREEFRMLQKEFADLKKSFEKFQYQYLDDKNYLYSDINNIVQKIFEKEIFKSMEEKLEKKMQLKLKEVQENVLKKVDEALKIIELGAQKIEKSNHNDDCKLQALNKRMDKMFDKHNKLENDVRGTKIYCKHLDKELTEHIGPVLQEILNVITHIPKCKH